MTIEEKNLYVVKGNPCFSVYHLNALSSKNPARLLATFFPMPGDYIVLKLKTIKTIKHKSDEEIFKLVTNDDLPPKTNEHISSGEFLIEPISVTDDGTNDLCVIDIEVSNHLKDFISSHLNNWPWGDRFKIA